MSHTFMVTVSDEEYKAFNLVVPDADSWVQHAVKEKIRQCGIRIAEEHSRNPSQYLTPEDRTAIKAVMDSNDDAMKEPKNWSVPTLREIINRTSMPTRAERDEAEIQQLNNEGVL